MLVIQGLRNIPDLRAPVAAAIGVFDGVHIGHQKILRACVTKAAQTGGTSVVVTFWPHPQKKASIYSLEHRLRLIAALGIDGCVVVHFNRSFSLMPARDFVRQALCARLKAAYVYVGDSFRFGCRAEGDVALLKQLGREYGYKVKTFRQLRYRGKTISSTALRGLITAGELSGAEKLLGRPVSILGTVIPGDGVGARLGFPTANLDPHHEVIPPHGVYAAKAVLGAKQYNAACYIGRKSAFLRPRRHKQLSFANIEVYLFGFQRKIYGEPLEARFISKVRDELCFKTAAALTAQIKKDIRVIRGILSRHV